MSYASVASASIQSSRIVGQSMRSLAILNPMSVISDYQSNPA
jgi:hypothetical protein